MMKKLTNLLFILSLAFFLVACEKKDANAQKLKEITIVLDWTPNTNHTGLYVAKDKGYFKDQGLKVNIVQPAQDSAVVIVGSKRAEFGIYFQPNLIKRLIKNVPITAVAAILQHNTAGIMTKGTILKPTDLQGKRYFTWEDKIDDATVKDLVKGDLVKIPGETTDASMGLKAGMFDYLLAYYGWEGIDAKIKDIPINFFFLKDYNKAFDYYAPIIIANNDFLKTEPDIAKKALIAIKKGYEYAAKYPDKSAEILIKYAPEGNPDLIKASQEWISKHYIQDGKPWGIFDINRWDKFNNWVYEQKLIDKKLPSSAGVTNEYLKN